MSRHEKDREPDRMERDPVIYLVARATWEVDLLARLCGWDDGYFAAGRTEFNLSDGRLATVDNCNVQWWMNMVWL